MLGTTTGLILLIIACLFAHFIKRRKVRRNLENPKTPEFGSLMEINKASPSKIILHSLKINYKNKLQKENNLLFRNQLKI